MTIPEDQLTTWAQIGAQTTSKDTYASIKSCVDAGTYKGNAVSYLQGSYGNDTNIRTESDVDVVMELKAIYYYDLASLPADRQAAFRADHSSAIYNFKDFRTDVLNTLKAKFGTDVVPGIKAITIKANGNRRKSDVLVCVEHHKIISYTSSGLEEKTVGICFFKDDGTQVVNYPRLHSENMTAKNQDTNGWFKHVVRIFKNARERLIADEVIASGAAPSYYIEGLLYNVPASQFGKSYAASVYECMNYLIHADRSSFNCANKQYPLLDGNTDVTWNTQNCDKFILAVATLWDDWGI